MSQYIPVLINKAYFTVPLKYIPFKFLKCFSMSLGRRVRKSGGLIFRIRLLTPLTCNLFSVCQTILLKNSKYMYIHMYTCNDQQFYR